MDVAAFYHFAPLPDAAARRGPLSALAGAAGLSGSVLLAPEGVNGTVAGPPGAVAALLGHVRAWPGFQGMAARVDATAARPFGRMKVRLKREVVTMGRALDPGAPRGAAVAPADWNAVLDDPRTVAVDVRNDFEVETGSFRGAVDPRTAAFGDFPGWWRRNRRGLEGRRVAMFCTGGIRCEKASALALAEGASEVVQLGGGILAYLAAVPATESLWRGECFVFDGRVSVGHGLAPGTHGLCHGCRRPVSAADRARPEHRAGVACHRCAGALGPGRAARLAERQRQAALAAARGGRHLGPG